MVTWGSNVIKQPVFLRPIIHVYRIDAMDAANEMKNAKAFNMIVLGVLGVPGFGLLLMLNWALAV